MIEVKQCVRCKEWFKKKDCEEVAIDSYYSPAYSASPSSTSFKTVWLCNECIKERNLNDQM